MNLLHLLYEACKVECTHAAMFVWLEVTFGDTLPSGWVRGNMPAAPPRCYSLISSRRPPTALCGRPTRWTHRRSSVHAWTRQPSLS